MQIKQLKFETAQNVFAILRNINSLFMSSVSYLMIVLMLQNVGYFF